MQSSWETEEVPIRRVEQRMFHLSHASWSLWAKTLTAHLDIDSGDGEVGHEETCPTAGASTPLAFGVPGKLEHVRGLLVPTGPNSLLATALPHCPPWLQVKEVGLLLGSFLEVEQLLGLRVLAQWSLCQYQLVVDGFSGQAGVFAAEGRGAGDLLMETLLWHVHLEKPRQDSVPSVTHQTYIPDTCTWKSLGMTLCFPLLIKRISDMCTWKSWGMILYLLLLIKHISDTCTWKSPGMIFCTFCYSSNISLTHAP